MQNIQLDLDEKALLIHALRCFTLANLPYTNSKLASGHNDSNLIVANRLLLKIDDTLSVQLGKACKKVILSTPIDSLDLTVRVKNFLASIEITTLYELVNVSEIDLIRQPHCGRKTINLIKQFLDQNGLSLLQE